MIAKRRCSAPHSARRASSPRGPCFVAMFGQWCAVAPPTPESKRPSAAHLPRTGDYGLLEKRGERRLHHGGQGQRGPFSRIQKVPKWIVKQQRIRSANLDPPWGIFCPRLHLYRGAGRQEFVSHFLRDDYLTEKSGQDLGQPDANQIVERASVGDGRHYKLARTSRSRSKSSHR